MKNIILSIIGITMFTIIGCDNLPTEPISNGNENYSISTVKTNNDEVLNNDAVPVSKDFIVNTKEIPLDTILKCFILTPEQQAKIDEHCRRYKWVQDAVKEGLPWELKRYEISFQEYKNSLNLNPKDSNYKNQMKDLYKTYNRNIYYINKKFSDSLSRYKNMVYTGIKWSLTSDQRPMWEKWVNNPKLTCEYLKP